VLYPLKKKKKAYLKGIWAEKIAGLYLQFNGYIILERRFKTPFGEIDLISRKGSTIIAVEVKTRATYEKAAFSVTPFQMKRIQNALSFYARRCSSLDLRFDVILISPWKWPRHIQGAWIPH
jgi:putative endonuclease